MKLHVLALSAALLLAGAVAQPRKPALPPKKPQDVHPKRRAPQRSRLQLGKEPRWE